MWNMIKSKDKDPEKRKLENKCYDKATDILKKIVTRSCTHKDVDELEGLYDEYFKKYPDEKQELDASRRIGQLRGLI